MSALPPVRLVAVVGGSGAGKSWLVDRLCRALGDRACRLQLDDFYLDRSHLPLSRRAQLNYDVPRAIDWNALEQALAACQQQRPAALPGYDFATYSRVARKTPWEPRPLVFIEGLWLLRVPALRARFDLSLYLDVPADVRCQRRLARDVVERGYSRERIEHQLRTAVVPMHARYVEPQRRWADLVLRPPFTPAMIAALAARLAALLADHATPLDRAAFAAELQSTLLEHEYCN